MKFKDLITKDFPVIDNANNILNLSEEFNLGYFYSENNDQLVVKSVYDVPHNSDEECYLYLLFLNNEFVATQSKHGDRSHIYFNYFNDGKSKLFNYVKSLIDGKEDPENNDIEEEINISSSYLKSVEINDVLYYKLDSPKWSYSFGQPKNHTYFILDEDSIVKQCEFIKFVDKKLRSYEDKTQNCKISLNGKK